MEWLIAARVLQGLGAAAIMSIVRAIVNDSYERTEGAAAFGGTSAERGEESQQIPHIQFVVSGEPIAHGYLVGMATSETAGHVCKEGAGGSRTRASSLDRWTEGFQGSEGQA